MFIGNNHNPDILTGPPGGEEAPWWRFIILCDIQTSPCYLGNSSADFWPHYIAVWLTTSPPLGLCCQSIHSQYRPTLTGCGAINAPKYTLYESSLIKYHIWITYYIPLNLIHMNFHFLSISSLNMSFKSGRLCTIALMHYWVSCWHLLNGGTLSLRSYHLTSTLNSPFDREAQYWMTHSGVSFFSVA